VTASRLALMFIVTAGVAACAVGPDYRKPSVEVPAAFKEAWQPAAPADEVPRGAWWQAYGDPQLDALEAEAEEANPTVLQAEANDRAARAAVLAAGGAFTPSLSVNASNTRSGTAPTAPTSRVERVDATASWEIDLWGKLRRGLEQSRANANATSADLAAARLSIAATLATNYVQLRALDGERALYATTLEGYRRSLEITRNRYAAGVAPSTDVTQAEATLASAEATDADLGAQRAVLEHAIAILTGRPPEALSISPEATLPRLPPIPAMLPATLLERRPDVAAAERRVAAANAGIGIARAAWFPALALSANAGYQGPGWQDLFKAPTRFWSVGPTLAETVFNGGQRIAQNATAKATYDAAVASYRGTVLAALQSTDDALANLRALEAEVAAANRASDAARATLRAVENQYRAGTVSYLNVVIAEGTVLSTDTARITVASRRLQAHIALVKAMGGAPVGH
jgi:NodT family efflux transporter outer membrane factor (OMF) lipoprotein